MKQTAQKLNPRPYRQGEEGSAPLFPQPARMQACNSSESWRVFQDHGGVSVSGFELIGKLWPLRPVSSVPRAENDSRPSFLMADAKAPWPASLAKAGYGRHYWGEAPASCRQRMEGAFEAGRPLQWALISIFGAKQGLETNFFYGFSLPSITSLSSEK